MEGFQALKKRFSLIRIERVVLPMTNKERIINTVVGKDIDRTPFVFYFGPWRETIEKWKTNENYNESINIAVELGYDSGFQVIQGLNLGF